MTNTSKSSTPLKGSWTETKAKLKSKFSTLTDSDLNYEEGKKEAMMTKIEAKLGKTKAELAKIITDL